MESLFDDSRNSIESGHIIQSVKSCMFCLAIRIYILIITLLLAISILHSLNNSNDIKKELFYLIQLNQNFKENDIEIYSDYGLYYKLM